VTVGESSGRRPSPEEPVSELRCIPIQETGEPLVPLLELCPTLYWVPRHPVFDYERFQLARQSLAEKLGAAAARLPSGIRLAIVEAWRPPEIQRRMHEETRRRLQAQHPEWGPRHLSRAANRFSAPMDPRVPPPHTTGGAVDLHLIDPAGQILDFLSPYSLMDPRGAPRDAAGLTPEARANRRLLAEVLEPEGLTNYPAEWWHWSYGDQAWAYRGGHPHALYGPIEPPGLDPKKLQLHPHAEPGW
jgi:D-alanyl-D-alanine dipeptidase